MKSLEGLRRIGQADVYKAGRLAATLGRTPAGATEFRYLDSYIADRADPIATTLPLTESPVVSASGSVPAFFAGLLPEGHRLTVLRRAIKTSPDDEFSLLLAVGADAPGDVQLVPAGEPLVEAPALVEGTSAAQLDFSQLVDEVDPQAIPGVQRKASASMISVPVSAGYGRFILKLSQAGYPHLIENEATHLRAARAMKLQVAKAELVTDRRGESGLLVERFDRVREHGSWRRLAFEDATQVLGVPPAAKYNTDAVTVVHALAKITHAPMIAKRNMYLQFLFAWLTGNGDLHAKNIGVLRGVDEKWRIAPIYDIPSTLFYDDDTMALPIMGRTRRLRSRHWREFAAEIGLPERSVASAHTVALRAAAEISYAELPFAGSPLHRVERELRSRRAELQA